MDYKKIKLENERSTHLTKRLNRLSAWGFFKVLYRNSFIKILAVNFLVLFCLAPIAMLLFMSIVSAGELQNALPYFHSFLTGTGMWTDVSDFYNQAVLQNNIETAFWCMLAAVPLALVFSGAFAVIRDAFWVGDINVLKRFAMGVASNIGYALVTVLILAATVSGTYIFAIWSPTVMQQWLSIVLTCVLAAIVLLLSIFLLILCSVSVTYRQSVKQNLDDSWHLLWLNILPNIVHFVIMLFPVIAFLLLGQSMYTIVMMFLLIFGCFYFPFVWQTHMMKTFALFHPVQVNKKGETKQQPTNQQPKLPEKA